MGMGVDKAGGGSTTGASQTDPVTESKTTAPADDTSSSGAADKISATETTADVPDAAAARPSAADAQAQRERRRTEVSAANYQAYQLQSGGQAAQAIDRPSGFRRGELEPIQVQAVNDPAAATESLTKTLDPDGATVVTGTEHDDEIHVAPAEGGGLTITSGDTTLSVTDDEARNLTIRAGGGDDTVVVDPSVTYNITIHGDAGDDTVTGGGGNDTIFGGAGNDTIDGGAGRDNIRGGAGNDAIDGGADNDQLVGGDGDDHVRGNDGHDVIVGGAGADRLDGGMGADTIYADAQDTEILAGGRSQRRGDGQTDTIIGEHGTIEALPGADEDVSVRYDPAEVDQYLLEHPELVIAGDDVFKARVRADLGVLLGTEEGRGLLDTITAAAVDQGEKIRLTERMGTANGLYDPETNEASSGNWAGVFDDGLNAPVNNTPVAVLYHELVHAHQDLVEGVTEVRERGSSIFHGGDSAPNLERQATGLSWMDADGTIQQPDILPFSENAFRRALGMPERTRYTSERGDPILYRSE